MDNLPTILKNLIHPKDTDNFCDLSIFTIDCCCDDHGCLCNN